MKSRKIAHRDIRKAVAEEFDAQYYELYCKAAADICAQNTATFLWTMMTRFGYGEKRLRQLVEALHDTEDLMENPSRMHHRFSPLECEEILKEKFGIDVREEFPPKVEAKP